MHKEFVIGRKKLSIDLERIARGMNKIYFEEFHEDIHIGFGIFHEQGMTLCEEGLKNSLEKYFDEIDRCLFQSEIKSCVSDCMRQISLLLMDAKKWRIQEIIKEWEDRHKTAI